MITAQLIYAFDFAYAKNRFSHDAAHIMLKEYLNFWGRFLETKDIFSKQFVEIFKYMHCIHDLGFYFDIMTLDCLPLTEDYMHVKNIEKKTNNNSNTPRLYSQC